MSDKMCCQECSRLVEVESFVYGSLNVGRRGWRKQEAKTMEFILLEPRTLGR